VRTRIGAITFKNNISEYPSYAKCDCHRRKIGNEEKEILLLFLKTHLPFYRSVDYNIRIK